MSDNEVSLQGTPIATFEVIPDKDDLYELINDVSKHPHRAHKRKADICAKVSDQNVNEIIKLANSKYRGETVLHTAIKRFQFKNEVEKEVTELLIEEFPKLLLQHRGNTEYDGQTPLHMAVCKGNIWLVDTMLSHLSQERFVLWKQTLLKRKAIGKIFRNTVMMGEMPLSIAALTFNKGMFDLLLKNGAEIDGVNRFGDNVCHSLIKYAYLYPDKMSEVMEMFEKINEDPAPYKTSAKLTLNRKLRKKIWVMENRKGLNPLQLAASLGLHQVFSFIMNLEVYCHDNSQDGLFDIKVYDVTEIDAISSMTPDEILGNDENSQRDQTSEIVPQRPIKHVAEQFNKSILMMLLELDPAVAFQFILFPPIRRIITKKWNAYRKFFYPWWIFHFVFMCFLTWYAVERSQQLENTTDGYDVDLSPTFKHIFPTDAFILSYAIICVGIGIVYIAQDIFRMIKGKMPWSRQSFLNPYSNGWFRVLMLLFALSLIVDLFPAIWSKNYEHYCLIIAVMSGWFLIIFFLRAVRPFSFFTVLIQKALISDMSRFFVIIGLEMVAFSTAMYMSIQGSTAITDVEYSNFGRVLFSMFKLMVGLGDTASLYDARHPAVCIIILIGFIVLTTLLMINALIAIMGRTCMELVENVGNIKSHERHWKLQRLSVILFLESIFPDSLILKVGESKSIPRYCNSTESRKKMTRYMLEIRSIQNENNDGNEDDDHASPTSWGFRTAVFKAIGTKRQRNTNRPWSGLSDKLRQLIGRRHTAAPDQPIPIVNVVKGPSAEKLEITQYHLCDRCSIKERDDRFECLSQSQSSLDALSQSHLEHHQGPSVPSFDLLSQSHSEHYQGSLL